MTQQRLHGVLSPVVTPVQSRLSAPTRERFVRHCKWLLAHSCCGLAVFGTNSEANSLVGRRAHGAARAAGRRRRDPARMMPGTGCCALHRLGAAHRARGEARLRRRADAAAVLLQGRVRRGPVPQLRRGDRSASAMRGCASTCITSRRCRRCRSRLTLIERLLKAYPKTIAGMKDSSGDWNNTKAMLDAFGQAGLRRVRRERGLPARRPCATAAPAASAPPPTSIRAAIDRLYREWQNRPTPKRSRRTLDQVRAIFQQVPMIPALKARDRALDADDAGWADGAPAAGRADARRAGEAGRRARRRRLRHARDQVLNRRDARTPSAPWRRPVACSTR